MFRRNATITGALLAVGSIGVLMVMPKPYAREVLAIVLAGLGGLYAGLGLGVAAAVEQPRADERVGVTSSASIAWTSGSTGPLRRKTIGTTDSEAVKRIHQVCCRLDDIAGSRRPA